MKRSRSGFTIIEVLMVLAIGGLITILVFVAASSASRSSRDTKRRADALQLSSALEQWAQNNNGQLPPRESATGHTGIYLSGTGTLTTDSGGKDFCSENYLPNHCDDFLDASGGLHTFDTGSFPPGYSSSITLTCNSTNIGKFAVNYTSSRDYSIQLCLESGKYTLNP